MPITVNSPYSGRPVKVRDQDVGRAVRDEEGRVFYVVPRSDGSGYYAAPTRQGSPRDEQRYDQLQLKMGQARESGQEQTRQQLHDATGRRSSMRGKLVILFFVIMVALLIWFGRSYLSDRWQASPPPANIPVDPSLAPEAGDRVVPPEPQADADRAERLAQARAGGAAADRLDDSALDAAITAMIHRTMQQNPEPTASPDTSQTDDPVITTASGLQYIVDRAGRLHGRAIRLNETARVHYTGYLQNGSRFDSSRGGEPFRFRLGAGQVIRGWDEGVAGMAVGEVRTLIVPPHLAYGQRGVRGLIPPNAALTFEIELIAIEP